MQESIDDISHEIEKINDQIKDLISKRLSYEGELIDLVGQKEEGSQTKPSKFYKVTTTAKVNRGFDKGFDLGSLKKDLGEEVSSKLIRTKYELVTNEYRALTDKQKAALSQYLTSKPAKTSVKVERIEVAK